MRKIRDASMLLAMFALLAGMCLGEEAAAPKFYKLDFAVKEVEGTKTLNSRNYSAVVSGEKDQGPCSIRAGSKVPMSNGSGYSIYELGVSIDCRFAKETPGGLALRVDVDISSLPQEPATPTSFPPTVRQNKWGSNVVVPLKKPTVIFSSDDLTGKHQMQLELTATPIT